MFLPSNAVLYYQQTFQSCQCWTIQQNVSGFQYNTNTNTCYTFDIDPSLSNIRIAINSQLRFVIETSTSYPVTTRTSAPLLSSPPIIITTSVSGNAYYTEESILLTNNITLTYLSIIVNVSHTAGLNNPQSYENFPGGIIAEAINDTTNSVIYTFDLINGYSIVPGHYTIVAQFSLSGGVRNTSDDTYSIRTGPYLEINGHF